MNLSRVINQPKTGSKAPAMDISNHDSHRFTTSGYKEIGIGKFEFVAKTQFFSCFPALCLFT